jgi:hypothetical protein
MLFNIQSRNNRAFTIKTKHSVADVYQKMPLFEEPQRKEREIQVINKQMAK